MIDRIAGQIDLAIDLLTLGQYGLEIAPDGSRGRDAASSSPRGLVAASAPASLPRDPWTGSDCARPRQPFGRARRVDCERPRNSTSSAGCQ